ncbi:MAG: M15 family metallopeptidase [Candidatus Edwardsbacteria bacterium]|nr:M15 family metallopeptidase [Candidatus Edwardsbacteria bacterium]
MSVAFALVILVTSATAAQFVLPPKPAPCPERWLGLIGKYAELEGKRSFLALEKDGSLQLLDTAYHVLREAGRDSFLLADGTAVVFARDTLGNGAACRVNDSSYARKFFPDQGGMVSQLTAGLPLDSLWIEANRASPPAEKRRFAKPDLADIKSFAPDIRTDLAFAGPRNSCGFALYDRDVALLQRPAARALGRAQQRLKKLGYGLLISDAYRPWHVTKFLYLAAPPEQRRFYADPQAGSHHNRGTAVDITLVELAAGREADMGYGPGEFSERATADYPGGTSLSRWHRLLLRRAMAAEGFRGLRKEWWHFRHISKKRYPINNLVHSRALAGRRYTTRSHR